MEEEAAASECNTGLGLGLGMGEYVSKKNHSQQKRLVQFHLLFPPKEETVDEESGDMDRWSSKTFKGDDEHENKNSNTYSNNNKITTRKKLRLTKEQTNLLENCFKQHSTPTPTQKLELAELLNLRPRQVEVWFQNRRARTKLKQTEVDCEFLKKCCESLSDENTRLKKELQELRLMNFASSPFYIQLPKAATLWMCPSCERIAKTGELKNMAVLGGTWLPVQEH